MGDKNAKSVARISNGLRIDQESVKAVIGPSLLLLKNKTRSEEHTSELQSPCNLVCRLLLEKKKKENLSIVIEMLLLYGACAVASIDMLASGYNDERMLVISQPDHPVALGVVAYLSSSLLFV